MANSFKLKIYTAEQMLFDGQADYISAKNSAGEFGAFAGHTTFSSDIVDGKIQIKSEDGTEKNIENGPGVISIKLDEIIIALESGTLT
tara:strand:+ start:75138 stop:75401 length:264 start_codon:yes stop_codon:yes gene_type:complete